VRRLFAPTFIAMSLKNYSEEGALQTSQVVMTFGSHERLSSEDAIAVPAQDEETLRRNNEARERVARKYKIILISVLTVLTLFIVGLILMVSCCSTSLCAARSMNWDLLLGWQSALLMSIIYPVTDPRSRLYLVHSVQRKLRRTKATIGLVEVPERQLPSCSSCWAGPQSPCILHSLYIMPSILGFAEGVAAAALTTN